MQFLRDLRNITREGTFANNLLWVASARSLAVVFSVLLTPVLSRIYAPEAYGVFAVFNAIVTMALRFCTLRLPNAFVLPKSDKIFQSLLVISVTSTVIIACITQVVLELGIPQLDERLEISRLGLMLHLIGPAILLGGLLEIVSGWIVREEKFKSASTHNVAALVSSKILTIFLGFIPAVRLFGILLGDLSLRAIQLALNFQLLPFRSLKKVTLLSTAKVKYSLRRYRDFPMVLLPNGFISQLINYLPIFFLAPVYGIDSIGQLTFSIVLLDLPQRLVGDKAINEVFSKKLVNNRDQQMGANTWNSTVRLYKYLVLLGFPVYAVLFFGGPMIYEIAFGEQWQLAGEIASIFSAWYFLRLINSPTNAILKISEKLNVLLKYNITILILTAVLFKVCIELSFDFKQCLISYTLLNLLGTLTLLIIVYRTVLRKYKDAD